MSYHDQFWAEFDLNARAERIVAQCIQVGGVEELRRVARLGLPLNRTIEDDSPELRQKVQEIADRLSRWEPLWLSGFRPGVVANLVEPLRTGRPMLLHTAPLAADDAYTG